MKRSKILTLTGEYSSMIVMGTEFGFKLVLVCDREMVSFEIDDSDREAILAMGERDRFSTELDGITLTIFPDNLGEPYRSGHTIHLEDPSYDGESIFLEERTFGDFQAFLR